MPEDEVANTSYIVSIHSTNQGNALHTNVHPNNYHHHSVDKSIQPSALSNLEVIHRFSASTQCDARPDTMHTGLLQIGLLPDHPEGGIQHTECGSYCCHQGICCQALGGEEGSMVWGGCHHGLQFQYKLGLIWVQGLQNPGGLQWCPY